ncbi:unnamed protein product [Chrysoparadoxa australica]
MMQSPPTSSPSYAYEEAATSDVHSQGSTQTGPAATAERLAKQGLALIRSKLALGPLRAPQKFLGLGEEKPYATLQPMSEVMPRLKTNVKYYGSNYLVVYGALVTMSIITSPFALISLGVLGAGFWAIQAKADAETGSLTVGSLVLNKSYAVVVMCLLSAVVGLTIIGKLLGWSLWLSGALALGHAAMRDATQIQDEAEAEEHKLEGELSIDPFL